jgi:zinc protease
VFPTIEKSTAPGGLRIWSVRHDAIPVVTITLLIRRGAADDPPGRDGLAAIAVDMLDEGTGSMSAIDFHESVARLGAQLDSDIGSDATLLSMTAMSRFTRPCLALLADMVVRPSLREEDFARVRQLRLHRLRQLRDLPRLVADRAFARLLYGDHPYGHMPLGHEAALAGLTVDDVRDFHRSVLQRSDATLIVVGDCAHEVIELMATEAFAGWICANGADRVLGPAPPELPPRLSLVPRPLAPQSELRIGHVAVARSTPDYHALVAANMVLGGQFVSRINWNLRERKGFTYGAQTSFDFRRQPGPFTLQTSVHTTATAAAISESIAEIAGIRGPRPVAPDELALGVAALTRGYARSFETSGQVARAVTEIALHDLPDDHFARFVPAIERVTVDDVTRAAATHLDPSRLTTLVVGDHDKVAEDLERLGLGQVNVLRADAA